jgi:hypothetical protein
MRKHNVTNANQRCVILDVLSLRVKHIAPGLTLHASLHSTLHASLQFALGTFVGTMKDNEESESCQVRYTVYTTVNEEERIVPGTVHSIHYS